MSGEWSDFAVPAAIGATALAAMHGGIAYACSTRKAPEAYVICIAALWVMASLLLGHSTIAPIHTFLQAPDFPHVLDAFLSLAPAAIVPGVLLIPVVIGRIRSNLIPALALGGSLLALPLTVAVSLYATCYIVHDCL